MFAQVIQGKAKDPAALRNQFESWDSDVGPGAEGFLGSTAGVTEDGRFILMARFESEDAARKNSDRAEQSRWWSDTEQHLEDPVFHDCSTVHVWLGGGSDDAGFVQAIQGPMPDEALPTPEQEAQTREMRPDVIGGVAGVHNDDGQVTNFVFFTSEEDARRGESKDEFQSEQGDMDMSSATFFDLKDPWMASK